MPKQKPSVLSLDAVPSVTSALTSIKGIVVDVGTFGSPYAVPLGSGLYVLDWKAAKLPGYKEADCVVVDMRELPIRADSIKPPSDGVSDWFTSGVSGAIDGRPYMMSYVQKDFDRILSHGGVFVIFARPKQVIRYVRGTRNHGRFQPKVEKACANYDLISHIESHLRVQSDHGTEMSVIGNTALSRLLSKHLSGGTFSCTFIEHTRWQLWTQLAVSKYDACVAAVRNLDSGGVVMLLPAVNNQPGFLSALFTEVLPELKPELFPELQRGTWIQKKPYELETVLDLELRAIQVRENAEKELATIREHISTERAKHKYLFDLVRETGAPLVVAVKAALEEIGFTRVDDIDAKMKAEHEDPDLREDLQVHDQSPLLTVDVKGLANFPSDPDVMQAYKHSSIRVQEYKRLDIRALAIINHQRHLPPLDRDNDMPFREELLKFASQVDMGMMTTWDLHRLLRNARKWGWKPTDVIPVFYRIGRIEPIPDHYTRIGSVEHVYEKARVVSVRLTSELRLGDRIAFELPVEFHEQKVESLQVDKQDVPEAAKGSLCGLLTSFSRTNLKVGTRVYRVRG